MAQSIKNEWYSYPRFSLVLEGKETDVEKLQARSSYDHLISKVSATPTAMKKYNETYNTENFQLGWEKNIFVVLSNNVRYEITRISTQSTS